MIGDEYYQAVYSSNPLIPDALAWAVDNLPTEFIDDYNNALETDDLHTFNTHLEYVLSLYNDALEEGIQAPEAQEEPMEDEPELSQEDQEIINETIEELQQQEPMGPEYAQQWDVVVEQAQAIGDETYAGIAAATAAFHSGEVSAEEAINYVLSNYDIQDVARVYQQLTALGEEVEDEGESDYYGY